MAVDQVKASQVVRQSDTDLMTMEQINTLQENFSDKISAISISESGNSGKVKNETTYANISTVGTNVGYQDVKSIINERRKISCPK